MRTLLAVILVATVVAPATTSASSEVLVAPFSCGTEWRGTTYGGHGQNNWNLDLNRVGKPYSEPLYDWGQPILAQGDGTVVHVAQTGWNNGAGSYLEVDYGDVTVVYVHLVESSIDVAVGDEVATGRLLGLLGNTGNIVSSTDPPLAHLHLAYWDSAGHTDARAYQLSTQLPVTIDGSEYTATAGGDPSPSFVSTNCDGYPFPDVPLTSIARDDIAVLHDLGIVNGMEGGLYGPLVPVSREQMAAFLARLWRLLDAGATDLPDDIAMPFVDVPETSIAHDDIALLAHLGITGGFGDGRYEPGLVVDREQMAAFLARLYRQFA